jgi:uncharacterized protein DUF1833
MRTVPTAIYERLDALLDAGVLTWVVAVELTTGQAFYLTPNSEPVAYKGNTYLPFPMELGEFPDSAEGNLPRTQLAITNVGRLAMPYLEGSGWDQARVVFQLVYLPMPTTDIGLRLDYTVQGAVATHETVTLPLGQPNFFDRPFPPHRFLRSAGYPGIPRAQQ